MKWLTRERVRIDRVACAWLIKKFIDPDAEFLFASHETALARAQAENVIPFVVPSAEIGRHGDRIGFDALIAKYSIGDPAVLRLADIVRAADVNVLRGSVPEAEGLRAIVHGFFLRELPDQQAIDLQMPMFEALYHYCWDKIKST